MIKKKKKKSKPERNSLNVITTIYGRPTATIFNIERLKAFTIKSGTRQTGPLLQLFQHQYKISS